MASLVLDTPVFVVVVVVASILALLPPLDAFPRQKRLMLLLHVLLV